MVDVALTGPSRFRLPGTPRTRIAVTALVVAAFGVGLLQDHGSHSAAGAATSSASGSVALVPKAEAAPQAQGLAQDQVTSGAVAAAPSAADAVAPSVDLGPSIVKTGTVALSVPAREVSATLGAVGLVATQQSGEVSDSKTDEGGAYPSGTITLRVPTDRTDATIAALRRLGHVDAVTTSSEDVTGQVVDVAARLKALDASRDRYLTLEGQATTIAETLQVQQRIDDVQTQIEQLEGEQKALADRTGLSTIAVTVTSSSTPTPVRVVHPRSGLLKAWSDARSGFSSGVDAVISASGTAAFLLLCAGLLGLLWLVARRVLRPRAAH